mgnify:CR=1 FL=1
MRIPRELREKEGQSSLSPIIKEAVQIVVEGGDGISPLLKAISGPLLAVDPPAGKEDQVQPNQTSSSLMSGRAQ